jgi:hypothetical protein
MKSGFFCCCCCRKRKERESEVVNWRDAVVGSVRSHMSLKRWFWSGGDVWREDSIASSLLSTFFLFCCDFVECVKQRLRESLVFFIF